MMGRGDRWCSGGGWEGRWSMDSRRCGFGCPFGASEGASQAWRSCLFPALLLDSPTLSPRPLAKFGLRAKASFFDVSIFARSSLPLAFNHAPTPRPYQHRHQDGQSQRRWVCRAQQDCHRSVRSPYRPCSAICNTPPTPKWFHDGASPSAPSVPCPYRPTHGLSLTSTTPTLLAVHPTKHLSAAARMLFLRPAPLNKLGPAAILPQVEG